MSSPRIVFAGTPTFAADHLSALISAGLQVVAVYSQPDRPAKRGKKLMASPVKQQALEHGIPIEQPLNFKEQSAIDTLAGYQPDILVVVAYGLILPQAVLDIPRIAPINVHASLLPRWRGAAPIERAIEAGDTETGVGIMVMEAGLDTGPVISEVRCNIAPDETGDSLRAKLSTLGCTALINSIDALQHGIKATAQADDGITYAHKLTRQETEIDWQQSAASIINKIRAFNSSNVTTLSVGDKRVKVWLAETSDCQSDALAGTIISLADKKIHIQCADQAIALTQLQMPGGKALASRDILNGHAKLFAEGTLLSEAK